MDWLGPTITLEEIVPRQKGTGREFLLSGSIYDEAGVDFLSINGVRLATEKRVEVFFTEVLVPAADFVGKYIVNREEHILYICPVGAFFFFN